MPNQPDINSLLKQAQKMQQQMADAQAELAEAELTGTAGGGLVTVTMAGTGEVTAVRIDPKAVDPDDVETLEDLVTAAIHNAAQAVRDLTSFLAFVSSPDELPRSRIGAWVVLYLVLFTLFALVLKKEYWKDVH